MTATIGRALLLLHFGLVAVAATAQAADKLRVGKAVAVGWTFTICEVGVAEGIFPHYGLDLDIIAFPGEAKLMQGFAADAVDVGIGSGRRTTVKSVPLRFGG